MKFLLYAMSIALLAIATGCTTPPLMGESEADVISKLGQPTHRYQDGKDHLLEYMQGPWGQYTYMARIGPDGRLVSYQQVLTTQKFSTIKVGSSTKADVLRTVGAPSETSYLPLPDLEVWSYPYRENGVWDSVMHIHFDKAGIVRKMLNMPDLRRDPDTRWPFRMGL